MPDIPLPLNFRSEVLGSLAAKLRAGECCSLLGVGSSGKSNVVRHLLRADVREHYFREDAPGLLCLYLDCNGLADYSESRVYAQILDGLSKEVEALGEAGAAIKPQLVSWWREAATPGGEPFARHNLESALNSILKDPSRKLVLVFDDCDALMSNASPGLLRSLRALRDDHKLQLMYVTVTRRELAHLRPMSQEFQSLFELFAAHILAVRPYREPDAIFMLERMAARQTSYPRPLSDAELRRLVEITGGHAGLLKQVYEATRHGERALDPNLSGLLMGKQLVWAECDKIWESLEDFELADLQAIALGRTSSGRGMSALTAKGLVLQNVNAQPAIFCPLLAEYTKAKAGSVTPPQGSHITLDSGARSIKIDDRTIPLMPTEFELFKFLLERRPQLCSYDELINHLMDLEPGGNPHRRLEQYLTRVRAKVEQSGRPCLVQVAGRGWRLVGEDGQ